MKNLSLKTLREHFYRDHFLRLLDGIIVPCPDKPLTNLSSRAVMEKHGWAFHVSNDVDAALDDLCGAEAWYGQYVGYYRGSVSTVFQGRGFAVLVFENCWTNNYVEVHHNSRILASAFGNGTKVEIAFQFFPGDKLEITENLAIIKLHSLSVMCRCMFVFLILSYKST